MKHKKLVGLLVLVMFIGSAAAGTASIDTISFKSDSRVGDTGKAFLFNVIVDGEAETINVHAGQSDIQSKTDKKVKSSFEFKTNNLQTKAKYPLESTSADVPFTVSKLKFRSWEITADNIKTVDGGYTTKASYRDNIGAKAEQKSCADIDGDGNYVDDIATSLDISWSLSHFGDYYLDYYCLQKENKLASGISDFRSPKEIWSVDAIVENGNGQTCRTTLTNGMSTTGQSAYMCNRDVRVDSDGMTNTGLNPPTTEDLFIAENNNWDKTSGWRVISQTQYNDWDTYRDNYGSVILQQWVKDGSGDDVVNTFNRRSRNVVNWVDKGLWSKRDALKFEGGNIDNGAVTLLDWSGGGTLGYPALNVVAEAGPNSFVVLEETHGQPKIVDVNEVKVSDTSSAAFELKVKNIGKAKGQFEVYPKSCTQGEIASTGKYVNLNSGETTTVEFVVADASQGTDAKTSGSCTFEMQDVVTQNTDTIQGSFTLKQNRQCQSNEKFRQLVRKDINPEQKGKETVWALMQCNSQGTDSSIIKTCSSTQQTMSKVNGAYSCVAAGGNTDSSAGGGSGTCSPWNVMGMEIPNYLCQFKQMFQGVLAVSGFLISIIMVPSMLNKVTSLPRRVKLGAGVAVGALIAYLSFVAFWFVVLVLLTMAGIAWIIGTISGPFT